MTNYELTIKDVNKSNSKFEIRNLKFVIIFIFLITLFAVGFFGWMGKADAQSSSPNGICEVVNSGMPSHQMTMEACVEKSKEISIARYKVTWTEAREGASAITIKEASKEETEAEAAATTQTESANLSEDSFPSCKPWNFSVDGCLMRLYYFIFITIPSWLLILTGMFFNAIVAIALSSEMYSSASSFISDAWTVVRDLSNIFFILVLLYISIKIILGLGGSEVKKMIANVVIMALLINFSMFFTKIVIDTSNVLALVFYNKLTVKTIDKDSVEENYNPATKFNEKDIAGAFVSSLNPNKIVSGDFYKKIKDGIIINESGGVAKKILAGVTSIPIMLGIMFVYGMIILFAVYAFFVTGLSFLGRLIELWILIIFSPFAFMSFTLPEFKKVSYIGWDAWTQRLLSVSFMAPIFMFFMYFIFMLLKKDIPGSFMRSGGADQTLIETILFLIIPALLVLILLLKATEFAKKGSGALGEMMITGAKIVGGLTLGAATGGTAALARVGIAGAAAKASQSNYKKVDIEHNKTLTSWESKGKIGPKPKFIDTLRKYEATASGRDRIGAKINLAQLESGEIDHARHEMEEIKKKAGVEGIPDKRLSGVEAKKVESTFIREKRSEIESNIKKGYDESGEEVKITGNGVTAVGENDYKKQRRQAVIADAKLDPDNRDASGDLNDKGKKEVEDKLNSEFNEILRSVAAKIGKEKFEHFKHEADQPVSMGTRIKAASTTGSYDVRNITDLWKVDKNASKGAKIGFGAFTMALAPLVLGMKTGLKKGVGDIGKVQGNFLKDMGNTISEALKNVKIDIKLEGGGGGGESHTSNKAHAPDNGHH